METTFLSLLAYWQTSSHSHVVLAWLHRRSIHDTGANIASLECLGDIMDGDAFLWFSREGKASWQSGATTGQ